MNDTKEGEEAMKTYRVSRTRFGKPICSQTITAPNDQLALVAFASRCGLTVDALYANYVVCVEEL